MKKFFALFMIISIFFAAFIPCTDVSATTSNSKNLWPKGPKIAAKSAIVMDASTGLVLYSKNIHTENYPASTTKLMTTLLALEHSSLNEIVTFSHEAVYGIEPGSSNIGINEGEELTMEQCLYGIMLESANEVSSAVAEHISGSISEFTKLMNQRAKELGCQNTNFVNANGLFNDKHHTSAYDLALISKELLNNKEFRKITSAKSYVIPPTNITKVSRPLNNHHKMLKNTSQYYEDCIGGKTGYTQKARYNLATFASRDNMDLICIIMNENNLADQYPDTKKLLDFGFKNYTAYNTSDNYSEPVFDSSNLFNEYNKLFCQYSTPLCVSKNDKIILPKSASLSDVKKSMVYHSSGITKEGENIIGSVIYTYGGKTVGTSQIIYNNMTALKLAKANVKKSSPAPIAEHLKLNLKPIIIGVILTLIAAISIMYYLFVEKPRLRRRKAFYERRKRTRETFDHDFMDFK